MHVQVFHNLRDGFSDRQLVSVKLKLRLRRRLVWRRNPSEFLDFISASLGLEAFGVALFADGQRRVNVDLHELTGLHYFTNQLTVRTIR